MLQIEISLLLKIKHEMGFAKWLNFTCDEMRISTGSEQEKGKNDAFC